MKTTLLIALAAALVCASIAALALDDAEIAHVAYTAGSLDVAAAKLALDKTQDPENRDRRGPRRPQGRRGPQPRHHRTRLAVAAHRPRRGSAHGGCPEIDPLLRSAEIRPEVRE
jgi:hypothetical protein